MKQETNPTLKQKKMIEAAGWNPSEWWVEREVRGELALISKKAGTIKILRKEA